MTDAQPGEDLPEETAEVAGYLPEEGQEENYEEGQEGQQEVPMEDGADGTYAEGETHEMPEEGQQGDAAEANVEEAEMNAEAEDGNAWWTGNTADDGAEGAEGQEMQLDAADGEIHQDDPSAEVPDVPIDPDDPSAPVKIEAGWEAASWFQEDDSRRLRKLERLAGGDAEVNENGTLKLVPQSHLAPPGGGGTGHGWCDLCAKALCALRTGEEIELTPAVLEILETSSDGDGLGICIIEVPGTVEKKAIAGKDGAKLLDLCDASDVLAVFTKEAEAPAEESQTFESFKAGDVVEGKYGESWFEVEVLESSENGVKVKWAFDSSESDLTPAELRQKSAEPEVKQGDKVEAQYGSSWFDAEVVGLEDGKVKVKWGFDGSEADVEGNQVRLKPAEAEATETAEAAEPAELPELKEGVKIEAKYGDSFHDAEVVQQTEDGKVKIKWAHDGSEAEVGTDELRAKVEPPPPPPSKLLVLGQRRPRMVCEVKVLNRIDGKLPGHVTSLHKSSVDGTVGLTIIDFKPGSDLGKLIGKQGAIKLRLERISGSCLEYMGKDTDAKQAFLVGTAEERARAQALIELLQTAVDFRVKATEMPPVLRELTSVLVVPGPASSAVSAKLELQALQDSTDTMILALAKPAQLFATQTQKKEFSKDQVVECKFKGEWQEATILEISSWTADSDEEDETDGRTMKVKLKDGTETTALAFNLREHLDGAEALERERQLQKQEQRELLIVGADAEKRHEAQLRLAAMLEAKCPGAYSKDHNFEGDRIAVTSMSVGSASFEEDFLRRLGTASSCEIVLEEQVVYFASGSSFECARAESFLKPFLGDPSAAADAAKVDEIDGINFILVEKDKQKNLPQRVLNEVADKLGVVAFFDDGTTLAGVDDSVRLNVVCWDADKQTAALEMLKELQDVEPPPEETWNNDQKWDGEEQKEESQEWKQDDWKKDDWKKDDQKKDDWKKDDWKKDDWKKDEWKKDDWKKDDKKDDWKKDEWKKNDQKNDWGKKDDWKKDEWKKNDQKNNDWGKKDDWKKDEWKKEDDWKGQDKKRKWEDENSSWGNDKKAKNDWEDKGGWGKEKDKGGGGGWNQKNDWEKDKSGQKWGSSSNEKSWEDKSWKKDSGSDWKDDSKSWDQKGKKWGQESQDDAWKGKKDDWKNTKDEWNGKQAQQTWEKKDSWGQKKQEWGQNDNKTWEDQKGWGQENKSEKGWGSNSGNQAQGWQKENKRQQQWDAQDQQDTKRWRTEGSPSSAPRMSRPAPWQKNNTPAASPKQVLDTLPAYPDSIDDWQKVQNQVWRGAKPLPDGWIRVWSKRHDCEYYLRLQDNYATFEQNEVFYA